MTTAHAFELPADPGQDALLAASDVRAMEHGQVIPLTRNGRPVGGLTPIDPDQAWFWTPEWRQKECEADEAIVAGRVRRFGNEENFLAALEKSVETGKL